MQPVARVEHFLRIGRGDQHLRQHRIGIERDRREQFLERFSGPRGVGDVGRADWSGCWRRGCRSSSGRSSRRGCGLFLRAATGERRGDAKCESDRQRTAIEDANLHQDLPRIGAGLFHRRTYPTAPSQQPSREFPHPPIATNSSTVRAACRRALATTPLGGSSRSLAASARGGSRPPQLHQIGADGVSDAHFSAISRRRRTQLVLSATGCAIFVRWHNWCIPIALTDNAPGPSRRATPSIPFAARLHQETP